MKKTMGILLALALVFSCAFTTCAAGNALTLEKNQYNSNGERHIKVAWTTKGMCELQLDDNANFESPIVKKTSRKYYNFVLSENVDATYYVRVKALNGDWSNVVTADIEKPIESEKKPYIAIQNVPSIPKLTINFSMIKFGGK